MQGGSASLESRRSQYVRVSWFLGIAMAMAMAGCGSPGTAPMRPDGPIPTVPAGFWVGTVGVSADDGRSLGLLWSASDAADGLSGTATLSTLPSASAQVTFIGTLNGIGDPNRLLLTYSASPATFKGSTCAVSGKGNAHLEDYTLVGDLEITYVGCEGLDLQPPASTQLMLLRRLN
jgi:hypothetical protein